MTPELLWFSPERQLWKQSQQMDLKQSPYDHISILVHPSQTELLPQLAEVRSIRAGVEDGREQCGR